jgi:hypothetical protein
MASADTSKEVDPISGGAGIDTCNNGGYRGLIMTVLTTQWTEILFAAHPCISCLSGIGVEKNPRSDDSVVDGLHCSL